MPTSSRPAKDRRDHSTRCARLGAQLEDLREQLGHLPGPLEAPEIWHDIWVQDTHHSTAIEGNTLCLKQVERLLDDERVSSRYRRDG